MLNIVGKHRLKNEAGSILFIVAAGIVVFIGIAGLAIDMGMLYNVRTDLQNAMDAAAMAGASQLNGNAAGINDAVTEAIAATNNYYFNTTPVAVAAADVTFSANRDSGYVDQATAAGNPAGIRFVKVFKQKTMDLALLKIIPGVGSTSNVSAAAVAGQSPPINEVCDGLNPMSPEPIVDPATGQITGNYVIGQEYTLRFPGGQNPPTGSGNYLLLDFSPLIGGSRGGALIRDLLYAGAQGCIGIGDVICSKTGVTGGPVQQGLNARFDSDTDTRQGIPYSSYTGDGRRILPVPIVSSSPTSLQPIDNGKNCNAQPLYIFDLVCFFLKYRVPNGNTDITGEFIGHCNANGKSDPTKGPPGRSGLPSERRIVLYR